MDEETTPPHLKALLDNSTEVRRLMEIHEKMVGSSAGRKHRVEVLNKSAIVLLIACWEAYVEDLANAAFEFMLSNAKSPDILPAKVRALAGRKLREAKDETKIWQLAGTGWRKVLAKHKEAVLERYTGTFNTPKTENVEGLFEALLGMRHCSSCWSWAGMPAKKATSKLDSLVELRGSIAHRVKASTKVWKTHVLSHTEFIMRLSAQASNGVADHLESTVGVRPWIEVVWSPE